MRSNSSTYAIDRSAVPFVFWCLADDMHSAVPMYRKKFCQKLSSNRNRTSWSDVISVAMPCTYMMCLMNCSAVSFALAVVHVGTSTTFLEKRSHMTSSASCCAEPDFGNGVTKSMA